MVIHKVLLSAREILFIIQHSFASFRSCTPSLILEKGNISSSFVGDIVVQIDCLKSHQMKSISCSIPIWISTSVQLLYQTEPLQGRRNMGQKKVLRRECKLTYCIVTQIATNLVEFNHCWVIQPKLITFPELFSSSQQSKTLEAAVSHCQWWVKANQRAAAAVPEDPSWEEAIPDKTTQHSDAWGKASWPPPKKKHGWKLQ